MSQQAPSPVRTGPDNVAFVALVLSCTVLLATQEAQTTEDAARTPQMPDPESRTFHAPCELTAQRGHSTVPSVEAAGRTARV